MKVNKDITELRTIQNEYFKYSLEFGEAHTFYEQTKLLIMQGKKSEINKSKVNVTLITLIGSYQDIGIRYNKLLDRLDKLSCISNFDISLRSTLMTTIQKELLEIEDLTSSITVLMNQLKVRNGLVNNGFKYLSLCKKQLVKTSIVLGITFLIFSELFAKFIDFVCFTFNFNIVDSRILKGVYVDQQISNFFLNFRVLFWILEILFTFVSIYSICKLCMDIITARLVSSLSEDMIKKLVEFDIQKNRIGGLDDMLLTFLTAGTPIKFILSNFNNLKSLDKTETLERLELAKSSYNELLTMKNIKGFKGLNNLDKILNLTENSVLSVKEVFMLMKIESIFKLVKRYKNNNFYYLSLLLNDTKISKYEDTNISLEYKMICVKLNESN